MARGHLRWTEDEHRRWGERLKVTTTGETVIGGKGVKLGARGALATPKRARGELRERKMNKTEAAYAQLLEARKRIGEISWYAFEAVKLRLADNTFYTPDFMLVARDGAIEIHEVKGHWRDDARVKIKVAAELFPFEFTAVTKLPARAGGGWKYEGF